MPPPPVQPSPPQAAACSPLAGKKVLVMGLGRFGGGVGVAKWLVQQGAIVTVNDEQPAEKLTESIAQLAGLPIAFKLGGHHLDDFLAADLLVINPAVDKQKNAVVREALQKGLPYTTEMNLFLARNRALTIGVTGSVGKSTTTTLIHEALKAALLPPIENRKSKIENPTVHLGGNIGRSLLLDLPTIRPADLVVLEISSFMLEDTPAIAWSPNIAVITNLFPNHLDRHGTLDAYAAAKQNILKFQRPGDVAILNADHEPVAAWVPLAQRSGASVVTYSARRATGESDLPLLIPGEHNQSNARAALAVLEAVQGVRPDLPLNRAAALHAITHFAGLSHRLQLVHTLPLPGNRPLRFYNDSKATTPEASITALGAFPPRSAIFLVGGYDKHIDLSAFETLLAQRAAGVIGVGQTGQAIVDHLRRIAGEEGAAQAEAGGLPADRLAYAATLEAALPLAHRWAAASPPIGAVVLSPASASWGQFANYEHRGETFIALARSLP